ncbi:MAG TPA: AgmX/PglI C-terminal domain-containing protein [Candidatus Limnocylindria bacterium]|nr:AgmX/PglI C-terminal domain-containing protein [Candidatus Limnocylindria bacterium]
MPTLNPPPRVQLSVVQGTQGRLLRSIAAPVLDRIALHRTTDRLLLRALVVASALLCVLFLIAIPLVPIGKRAVTHVILPPQVSIVVQPEPEVIPEQMPENATMVAPEQLDVRPAPAYEPPPEPALPGRRHQPIELPPDAGKAGRERAEAAAAKLKAATASLDKALGGLSSALQTPAPSAPAPNRRRSRDVRSGRSDGELASVPTGSAGSGASVDLDRSVVQGARLAIGTLSAPAAESSEPSATSVGSGAAPGIYRTNASLLAVIQKYAAGIQYCYENELKRDVSLRGKLVVAITVAASGRVQEATVVDNTVRSQRLEACALSQIKDWKFPPIPEGATTFQAPFVFTPPN